MKKTIFSGIQPTGFMTLGNYIGAVNNWTLLQEQYNCIYCVVDMHCITVRQDPKEIYNNTLSFLAQLIACGLDPNKCTIFIQSHVSGHAELAWALGCNTYIGELSRMTQFKDKSRNHGDNINVGLMNYPVLMAADILLYNASLVPVGIDQKQHLELTRDLALRFNKQYGDTFVVPEPYITTSGAKVYSLQDPTSKMSKSDPNPNATISIIESSDSILKKFKKAVTDSDNIIKFSEDKPGVSNLLTIYSAMKGCSISDAEEDFVGATGYGTLKMRTAEVVIEKLRPIREKYEKLIANPEYLLDIAYRGAEQADSLAKKTLLDVYSKIGFVPKAH